MGGTAGVGGARSFFFSRAADFSFPGALGAFSLILTGALVDFAFVTGLAVFAGFSLRFGGLMDLAAGFFPFGAGGDFFCGFLDTALEAGFLVAFGFEANGGWRWDVFGFVFKQLYRWVPITERAEKHPPHGFSGQGLVFVFSSARRRRVQAGPVCS